MNKNLFIISEEEKNRILGLHDSYKKVYGTISLNEQETKSEMIIIPLTKTFASGKYKITNESFFEPYIKQINDFLKSFPKNRAISIQISAGESQVPNYDREKYPITGNNTVDFSQEKKLPPGDLANKRMDEIERLVKEKFSQFTNVKVTKTQPVIGTTPWDSTQDANDPKYIKEQFIQIKIKALGESSEDSPKPKCKFYDFNFGNATFRTLSIEVATKFLNALRINTQKELSPNCINFVGETYQEGRQVPSLNNQSMSHFKETKGYTQGSNDNLYLSSADYNNNRVWFNPVTSYGMTRM